MLFRSVVLEFNMDVSRGMVVEKASSGVHFVFDRLSSGCKQSTFGAANEMVDRDLLTWDEVIVLQNASSVTDNGSLSSRCRTSMLFSELTGGTFRRVLNLASGLGCFFLVDMLRRSAGCCQD